MLVHNMRCAADIMRNPRRFPNADQARVYARWERLHDFLAVEFPTEYANA
jgi:hypothetical protein